jgi:hypothetical protein
VQLAPLARQERALDDLAQQHVPRLELAEVVDP